ncbi:TMEM165/GDT1 family protein [Bacillus subtilis]|uniref:TMEM165/GDT1 family protein n=1 Tax=Bacillus subtilis TaxID=1423 RepID=A0AAX3RNB2_BACIU|nr:TMEM165/GDT1 family protein [Bacillus subtilis]OTQ88416.1 hypothetical protein BG30_00155 [Bacillus subtilis subsp. subtilis]MEC0361245.1 TMEM165/GDT1 family protein [Bacillus subtilis]WEY84828.1 TMEM165/GDT1 family protein [Bacillus subtilis]WEZ04525.1 TMEM165/GDT1 family protein [Bacillus subtilis]
MKKLVVLLTALSVSFSLAACSSDQSSNADTQSKDNTVEKNTEKEKTKKTIYDSKEQEEFVKTMKSDTDFNTYVNKYYNLPSDVRTSTYDKFIYKKEVIWSGTVADSLSDSVIVYGGKDGYNGEDWSTLSSTKADLLPYVFVAELKDKTQLATIKKGQTVKVKGEIGSRGDKDSNFNWKLYESEIVK